MADGDAAFWICPDRVFDGHAILADQAILVENGRATDLQPSAAIAGGARRCVWRGLVSPGFIDLQVNGGADVLVNSNPTATGFAAIAAAHRRFGTVGILPTVISDRQEVLQQAAQAAKAAAGLEGLLGLHIEGPHIALARRGTHAADSVRSMDAGTIGIVQDLRAAGVAVMITLAPEAASLAQIAQLAAMGAVVSLGHSDATADLTRAALDAGVSCFTHLFNAMSPMLSRAPGMTGAAINSGAYAGIICDGIHVADEMVGLAIRARLHPDRMFLVSDAMPTVGGGHDFQLYGKTVRLVDGRLLNEDGALAGAHTTMAQSLARLVMAVGIDAATALRMAVTVPAQVIGRPDLAQIIGRRTVDLLRLDAQFQVSGTCADLGQQPD